MSFNLKLVCGYEEVSTPGVTFLPGISTPCVKKNPVKPKPATPDKPEPPAGDSPSADKGDGGDFGSLLPSGPGTSLDLAKRQYALGVGVSYLRGDSDLAYAPTDPPVDRTVQVWAFETFYDRRFIGRHGSRHRIGCKRVRGAGRR